MSRLRRILTLLSVGLLVAMVFFFGLAPGIVDGLYNRVGEAELPRVSERAHSIHGDAFIVDLHADPLLWERDLTVRNTRGHVDYPRLRDGNVALQVFSAVTQSPRGMNYERNTGETDTIGQLTVVGLWPISSWTDYEARAHYQAKKLRRFLRRVEQPLVLDAGDFNRLREADPRPVGALLALEGLHCLNGDLEAIDRLYDSGYRMFGLAHFFDNAIAGSAHGVEKHGLTRLGVEALGRIEGKEALVDLAHSSEATITDVLSRAERPVVVSHTGVRAVCDSPRNLSDAQLRALAANGALIGIGYWDGALCSTNPAAIARSLRHVVEVAGLEHAALGSDFDGATEVAFDASELSLVTQALLDEGFTEQEIRAVLGENAERFFSRWLPGGG